MAPINWQEPSQTAVTKSSPEVFSSSSSSSNPWFAVSIGLMGVIVGFAIGSWRASNISVAGGSQIAAAPIAPPIAPTAAAQPQPPQPAGKPPAPIDPKADRIRGDLSKAKAALIEYSDFECPFCKRFFPTAKQVLSTYGDKVAFVYRDFPLSFHQNAHKEAEAGRCVFALGGNDAFWKYHDYVFDKTTSNGTGFPLDQLPVAAKQAGVESAKFQTCLDGGKYSKLVDDEETSGGAAGVTGTPGNFVVNLKTNDFKIISGAYPFDTFKTAIDAMLQ
ncbi:DsbA family protein [Candidatus Peregrinibacteria bacterium]|nr:DsbA family protein [Candidatus Peregrinibacteria bacterium]